MKKVRFSRLAMGLTLAVLGMATVGSAMQPLVSTAFAEEAVPTSTMTVSPMWQKIILTPGENWSGSIRVGNPDTATQNLKYSVSVGSYSVKSDGSSNDDYGSNDVQTVSDYNQMMQWITLGRTSGVLAPNTIEEIPLTINVPADAPGGGQYASIIVKDETEKSGNEGNLMIQSDTQTASIIYAEVTGDTREEGKILENSVPSFLLSGPIEADSMVENDGNVHTDASYVLQVWPLGSNEEICTNEEEPATRLVMPETKMYHTENCEVGAVGIYRVKQTVKIFGETSEVERMVFVCPIWLILIILIAIVVIIWLIVKRVRSRR